MRDLPNEVPILTEFSMVLLESRRRGLSFDEAWSSAMRVLRVERGNGDDELRAELKSWKKAITWAREHFEACYESQRSTGDDPSLSDALSAHESAGNASEQYANAEHAVQR